MRPVRALLAFACLVLTVSCASDVDGLGMSIKDPLDLIDDIDPGGLRLYVLPGTPESTYTCDSTTGDVTPEVPRLPEGMFEDAVADLSLDVSGSRAMTTLEVPAGEPGTGREYVVLVRGTGMDMVTGIPDSVIAVACATVTIEPGETREVRLTLIPKTGMGMCGDPVLSPDEQCEDMNTADGDGCSATCRTEPFAINTTTTGTQETPSAAGSVGQRWVFSYLSERTATLVRFLEPNLAAVDMPGALIMDAELGDFTTGATRALASDVAVANDGRVAIAFIDFMAGQDIEVAFYNQNRTPDGPSAVVRDGMAGTPSIAFAGDGAAMVVFEDTMSSTGLSGQIFAAGSATPASADPFEIGQGTTGGRAPSVSGASDHFVVAFGAGGVAHVQRFGTDGAPRDAMAAPIDGGAMQDQAAVAALADGRALVAWREGGGAAIRARFFGADGTAAGDSFDVNTGGSGLAEPSVAAGQDHFAVAFQSGAGVRGRVFDGDGDPALNREQPPTTGDFPIAAAGTTPDAAVGGATGEPRWMAVWNEGGDIRGRIFPLP